MWESAAVVVQGNRILGFGRGWEEAGTPTTRNCEACETLIRQVCFALQLGIDLWMDGITARSIVA